MTEDALNALNDLKTAEEVVEVMKDDTEREPHVGDEVRSSDYRQEPTASSSDQDRPPPPAVEPPKPVPRRSQRVGRQPR